MCAAYSAPVWALGVGIGAGKSVGAATALGGAGAERQAVAKLLADRD
jgi:hypothetical protein